MIFFDFFIFYRFALQVKMQATVSGTGWQICFLFVFIFFVVCRICKGRAEPRESSRAEPRAPSEADEPSRAEPMCRAEPSRRAKPSRRAARRAEPPGRAAEPSRAKGRQEAAQDQFI